MTWITKLGLLAGLLLLALLGGYFLTKRSVPIAPPIVERLTEEPKAIERIKTEEAAKRRQAEMKHLQEVKVLQAKLADLEARVRKQQAERLEAAKSQGLEGLVGLANALYPVSHE